MAKILSISAKRDKRDALVSQHLGLVRAIAVRLAASLPPCFAVEDLIGAGNIALLGVAERYDARLNDNFVAYARTRIRGAMLDSVKRKAWTNATMEPLESPAPANDAEVMRERAEVVVFPSVDADLDRATLDANLWRAVSYLPPRLRTIVELTYREGLTAAEIGVRFGVNASRIRQRKAEALEQLRILARSAHLRAA